MSSFTNAIRTIDKIPSVTDFAWHYNILTNPLRFICLFVNVNEIAKAYEDFYSSKSAMNRPNPMLRKEMLCKSKYLIRLWCKTHVVTLTLFLSLFIPFSLSILVFLLSISRFLSIFIYLYIYISKITIRSHTHTYYIHIYI